MVRNVSVQVEELILWCLEHHPEDRPTVKEIFQALHGLLLHPKLGSQELALGS